MESLILSTYQKEANPRQLGLPLFLVPNSA